MSLGLKFVALERCLIALKARNISAWAEGPGKVWKGLKG